MAKMVKMSRMTPKRVEMARKKCLKWVDELELRHWSDEMLMKHLYDKWMDITDTIIEEYDPALIISNRGEDETREIDEPGLMWISFVATKGIRKKDSPRMIVEFHSPALLVLDERDEEGIYPILMLR